MQSAWDNTILKITETSKYLAEGNYRVKVNLRA